MSTSIQQKLSDSDCSLELQNPIISGPIWRQILFFFFPVLLGTFFQQLYNTADAIIVGNFVGKEALAAVGGTTNVLISFLVNLFVGVASGSTVVIAQQFGGQDYEGVNHSTHTSMLLAFVAGFFITILGIVFARPALVAMGTPADILDPALVYMRIYFLGTIASFIYNMGSGIMRALGDTKRPMYYLIAACVVNILLDILFVVIFRMGVAGAGWATVLSQVVSAVLIMQALIRAEYPVALRMKEMKFYPNCLGGILRIGLPCGVQNDMYTISNILIQSCINSFGTNTVAAWTAFSKIDGFYWMLSGAFGIAITTFIGQNYGARRMDRIHRSIKISLLMNAGSAVAVSALFCVFATPLLRLFSADPEVLSIGVRTMFIMAPFYVTFIFIEILSGAIRGMGISFMPMVITCCGVCVLRVLWIFLVLPLNRVFDTVLISYPFTWIVTSVLFIFYYWKGSWRRKVESDLLQK